MSARSRSFRYMFAHAATDFEDFLSHANDDKKYSPCAKACVYQVNIAIIDRLNTRGRKL